MNIAISGASGLVGSTARSHLASQGYQVRPISRSMLSLEAAELAKALEGVHVVIHLAGAPIMKRWTKGYRREIYDSRIETTRRLTAAMEEMDAPPHTFITASAVGIYPTTGTHDEGSEAVADNFLGEVCRDWEAAAAGAPAGVRTVMLRFGVILSSNGGALQKMLPPFRLGLGGPIAGGRQTMPWVHMDDVMGILSLAVSKEEVTGPVNVTAPQPVTNKAFTRALGRALGRPAFMPLPAFALQLVYGQAATVLTEGQHAIPTKVKGYGYVFHYPELDKALEALV